MSTSTARTSNGNGASSFSQENDKIEPIAIIGFSFGFPQDATSSDAFWKMLMERRSSSTAIPAERLNAAAMYHPDGGRRGQMSVRCGHFLSGDIAAFDAPFFSISASDAAAMDPQQRLLLEYTYKALENAGLPLESVIRSKTSVYSGCFTNDWQHLTFKDSEQCDTTAALGIQPCVNANRISWFYNFTGNSANIDTACSSSLVALDMGCKGLLCYDTEMSVVTGSNLIFSPDTMHALTNMNMLSPDGQSYSFDHRAHGYARGEGIGVLVLKRLSDALRDQDTIRALVRNTGCNQDGYTPGITQPSSLSQESLIRETYARAGLSMEPTRFFEAHGTGTPVGDPIEATAVGAAFRKARTNEDPLYIGAVKSNIGHLEGASGIAGVIKAIMVLEKGIIPPNYNLEKINSKIDTEFLRIKFPLEPTLWPTKGLRRASVNSFGFGGTNAHAVLDDVFHYLQLRNLTGHHMTIDDPHSYTRGTLDTIMPNGTHEKDSEVSYVRSYSEASSKRLLIFSGHDKGTLKRQIERYTSHFRELTISKSQFEPYLLDLEYTLLKRRTPHPWKSFAVVSSVAELKALEVNISTAFKSSPNPKIGFVFTGQGAQWVGMGRELQKFPAFQASLEDAQQYLLGLGCPWRLVEKLWEESELSNIDHPEFSQPLCTAIQVALISLLRSLGIRPTAVIGHSSGEIAAAYAVGAISARAAWRIAYYRGTCAAWLRNSNNKGAMVSVGLSKEQAERYLNMIAPGFEALDLTVACINSPKNVTISGDVSQVDALQKLLSNEGIFARKLRVDVAYHSPHMRNIAEEYKILIGEIEKGDYQDRTVMMISTVTGQLVTNEQLVSPEYWVSNMISPVKFSDAMGGLCIESSVKARKKLDLSHRKQVCIDILIEIGPHPALQGPIRDILNEIPDSTRINYVCLLARKISAIQSFLGAIGQLHCLGYAVDFRELESSKSEIHRVRKTLTDLPEYSFDHSKSYWYESRLSKQFRTGPQGKLDLLGKPVPDWNPLKGTWRNMIRVSEMPWVEDHVINGSLVYPAAGMLVMAIEAANQMADPSLTVIGFELKDALFRRPLTVPQDTTGVEVQLTLHQSEEGMKSWSEFQICVFEENQWQECSRGSVRVRYQQAPNDVTGERERQEEHKSCHELKESMARSFNQVIDPSSLYTMLQKSGFGFGPAFQTVTGGCFGENGGAVGDVRLFQWPEKQYPQNHIIHPTSLDGMLHLSIAGLAQGGQKAVPTMIPTLLRNLWISKSGLSNNENRSVEVCTWKVNGDNRGSDFNALVFDPSLGTVLGRVNGLRLTIIADVAADQSSLAQNRQICYHLEYRPDPQFLTPEQTSKYCHLGGDQALQQLSHYLDLLGNKNPGLKILDLGVGDRESTVKVIDALLLDEDAEAKRYLYQLYHYTDTDSSSLDTAREKLSHYPRIAFEEFDAILSSEESAYDLVIVNDMLSTSQDNATILQDIQRVLSREGRLITLNSEKIDPAIFTRNGFAGVDFQISTADQNIMVATPHPFIVSEDSKKQIVFVHDPQSAFQVEVARQLAALTPMGSHRPQSLSLTEVHGLRGKSNVVLIFLLELDGPFLYTLSSSQFDILREILIVSKDVLWVNAYGGSRPGKPEFAMASGLARALRNEYENLSFSTLALDLRGELSNCQLLKIHHIFEANHLGQNTTGGEWEYIEIDGLLNIPRIVESRPLGQDIHVRSLPEQSSIHEVGEIPPVKLIIGSPGLLDTLQFVEDDIYHKPLDADDVEIRVHAIGVNFKDCLIALGQVPGDTLGLECAGVVTRVGSNSELKAGDRVVMATPGSFKTHARGKAGTTCRIPPEMSFAEAATIPAQFGTAWEVLHELAKIRKGETVLIHAAAGGTGQAAVQIAQHLGATVFATVGSKKKKDLLVQEYGIPEERIFYSRDTSFAQGIMRATGGRGVDVVLNSLAGDSLRASWACIANYGRFVEIGKKDVLENASLPMLPFGRNAAFIGFDASTWQKERPLEAKRDLQALVNMFAGSFLHSPRPLLEFQISEVEHVFRLLQDGKTPGKIVIKVDEQSQIPATLNTRPSFSMSAEATFVIAGGLGGLGRSISRWMASRGARHLILLSRSGPRTEMAHAFLRELRDEGVHVEAPACDVADTVRLKEVFAFLTGKMPPIKGCIQGSMVRRDELFENMSYDSWKTAVECKTVGSWNLHTLLPKGMDFFILLSSASGLVGLRGQTNYAAGNTYEDAIARFRVAQGEKAISLDLGAMIDDGLLAENPELLNRVLTYGSLNPVRREQLFAILDYYCDPSRPLLGPRESQAVIGLGTGGGTGLDSVSLDRLPLFRHLIQDSDRPVETEEDSVSLRQLIAESTSLIDAANIVTQSLIQKLSKSISTMQHNEVDIHKPLHAYGVDSLLAVELRNWIAKEFQSDVAVFETLGSSTFSTLAMLVAGRSEVKHPLWTMAHN
ncbi:reducing type I polyketide synthase [Penicillium macrosclerotiorum]|uniref:reducing type I polyketide synthase n=1 Tax=Penicillium macrosclerotiorum TaxID=303699 RepID=UPI0025469CE2|nr:reducing type I polyketide synthase [Penicillium macrosclerotiorum]KAJ5692411.1 reducing type I polyketide synthase [Penicillium macrosclerotiorum]